MAPIISVIVPVYNAADYLKNTLNNIIVDQFISLSPDDWELIVVNDGSTDNSLEILRAIANDKPNIKIIDKPNSGAADSRNVGFEAARGEFVFFFDSDDLMSKNALAQVCNIAALSRCDIIKINLKHISTEEYQKLVRNVPQIDIVGSDFVEMTVADYLNRTQAMTSPIGDSTWLTVYRRSFLCKNNLKFNPAIVIGEDVDLIWRAMFYADRIIYIERELYFYHLRSNSISRSKSFPLQAYTELLYNMLEIQTRYQSRPDMISPGADAGLQNTIRYLTNLVLSHKIISGATFVEIYRFMNALKFRGADIHPGRPRFDKSVKKSATLKAKLRRWFVAYILVLPIWIKK